MAVPYNGWSQSERNRAKREDRQAWERGQSMRANYDSMRRINQREENAMDDILNQITDRVQKQHPGMKRVKARLYARRHDPVGRKYDRMMNAGYSASQIRSALFGGVVKDPHLAMLVVD